MGLFDSLKGKALTPEERRDKSNARIKKMGIACLENLPTIESSSDVKLKDLDVVCKRAIACLLSASCASTINQGDDVEKTINFHITLLQRYGLTKDDLLPKERAVFDNRYSDQNLIDVVWSYEIYWTLIWAMDLITDKEMDEPITICNVERAIAILMETSGDYEFFKGICKLRDIEKILDMLDLYYRYHWACEEKRLNPQTDIGKLYSDVVMERRRGLEWLVSDKKDWNDISLDT